MNAEKPIFISEEEKLKNHLSKSHTERFRMLMQLIKLGRKMKKAKIIYPKP